MSTTCRSMRIACSGDIPALLVFLEEVADANDGPYSLRWTRGGGKKVIAEAPIVKAAG